MLTRKMKTHQKIEDNVKLLQDDLNKSVQLNEQLLKEQNQNESDFKTLLDSNKKLKNDLLEMEEKYLTKKSNCEEKEKKLLQLTAELQESETFIQQKHQLDQHVQQLKYQISLLEEKNTKLEKDLKLVKDSYPDVTTKLSTKTQALRDINDEINSKSINAPQTDVINSELKRLRCEIKFKNAEVKTLRKKSKMSVKKSKVKNTKTEISSEIHSNANINHLQHLYNNVLEKSETNVAYLEETIITLKNKIADLEDNCKSITESYDKLSAVNKINEEEKLELHETITEMEQVLQEGTDEDNIEHEPIATYTDINPRSNNPETTLILGNECTEDLGTELMHLMNKKVNVCCFTYRNAPVHYLIETAKHMANNKTNNIKVIVLITRKVHYKSSNAYVDEIIRLHEYLKRKYIRLVCTNMSYSRGITSAEAFINGKIYDCNTKLHNYTIHEKSLDVINISGISFHLSSKTFRILIAKYVVTYLSNITNDIRNYNTKEVF